MTNSQRGRPRIGNGPAIHRPVHLAPRVDKKLRTLAKESGVSASAWARAVLEKAVAKAWGKR